MNYRNDECLGSTLVAVGTGLFKIGSAGYQYYTDLEAKREYDSKMESINAQNTADARNAARQAGYAENFKNLFGDVDKEKTKRYLIIGAAIGVPLIAGLILSKKKG